VDFVGGLLSVIKTDYGVDIPRSAITEWNLHPVLDPIIGEDFWDLLKRREWLWAGFPPIDGAIGSVWKLRQKGHYMELVTSKPIWASHNMYKWLGRYRPAFQRVTIVDKDDRKVDFTDADVLIDDKPANCEGFIEEGRKAIMFTSHHNMSYQTFLNGMERADDWSDVLGVIESYASEEG